MALSGIVAAPTPVFMNYMSGQFYLLALTLQMFHVKQNQLKTYFQEVSKETISSEVRTMSSKRMVSWVV